MFSEELAIDYEQNAREASLVIRSRYLTEPGVGLAVVGGAAFGAVGEGFIIRAEVVSVAQMANAGLAFKAGLEAVIVESI